jgi:hypothetical protein
VRQQLGHTTASITLDTYGHLVPDELDALPGRLEDLHGRALAARRAPRWPRGRRVRRTCRSVARKARARGGPEPGPVLLRRPRSERRTAHELRFSVADRDRSCPPRTSGSWCRADPARTRAASLGSTLGPPAFGRWCSATGVDTECC